MSNVEVSIGNEKNPIHLKKKLVINAVEDSEILNSIWRYRSLVNDEIINIMIDLNTIHYDKSVVTSRVKAQNSIEFKWENENKGGVEGDQTFYDFE